MVPVSPSVSSEGIEWHTQLGRTVIVSSARPADMYVLVTNAWATVVDRECPFVLAASGPSDRFCVRECYLPLMLSYLCPELLHVVHARPLVSVAVSRDRYSVGYSPPGCGQTDHLPNSQARGSGGSMCTVPVAGQPRHTTLSGSYRLHMGWT